MFAIDFEQGVAQLAQAPSTLLVKRAGPAEAIPSHFCLQLRHAGVTRKRGIKVSQYVAHLRERLIDGGADCPCVSADFQLTKWYRVEAQWSVLEQRHEYALTLVTAPDSPWQEDGLQRESDEVRQTVHQQVLEMLADRGIDYFTVQGSLGERLLQVAELLSAISLERSMLDESR